ncbi:hypothetical protein CROQUDRAFT_99109 [Cronartium quercuum f. sp. fusiforme G11]|uniref:Uncharacterized protein n=1 Tax=Cronartium quercuum f. sp. fusiforme G11 TaxID=708437 RepID=A0A9P6T767_9BASI|nr:hypothetical protein CROQUDRAFT_99109 [Cronartium quercuum f. sp. fusiforme G11]
MTINLVFVNDALDDILQTCMVDEEDLTNHHSDHQALITIFSSQNIDLNQDQGPGPTQPTAQDKNWCKVNIPLLKSELMMPNSLPEIKTITTQEEIDAFDQELQGAVVQALNKHSPNQAPAGKHKAWWRPELHKPLRKAANRAKRTLKTSPMEEN